MPKKPKGFWLSPSGENHGTDSRPGDRWVTLADLTGAELIAMERQRQKTEEQYSDGHDDGHADHDLALAGARYALPARQDEAQILDQTLGEYLWPWSDDDFKPEQSRVRNLVKAGALIAAEIDRLQRLEKRG